MRSRVGLWIDHRKAIVVTVTDEGEEITLTISGVERQLRRSGDSLSRVPMNHRGCAQMISSRGFLRDASTSTTMPSLRPLVTRNPF